MVDEGLRLYRLGRQLVADNFQFHKVRSRLMEEGVIVEYEADYIQENRSGEGEKLECLVEILIKKLDSNGLFTRHHRNFLEIVEEFHSCVIDWYNDPDNVDPSEQETQGYDTVLRKIRGFDQTPRLLLEVSEDPDVQRDWKQMADILRLGNETEDIDYQVRTLQERNPKRPYRLLQRWAERYPTIATRGNLVELLRTFNNEQLAVNIEDNYILKDESYEAANLQPSLTQAEIKKMKGAMKVAEDLKKHLSKKTNCDLELHLGEGSHLRVVHTARILFVARVLSGSELMSKAIKQGSKYILHLPEHDPDELEALLK